MVDKLQYILKKGRQIRGKYRKGEPIEECSVSTWVNAEIIEGKIYLYPDSDSLIVAGILALIKEHNDGKEDIDLSYFEDIKSILPENIVTLLDNIKTIISNILSK
jgi:sulfur transfer protein SufE